MENKDFTGVTTYINIQPGAQYQPHFESGATNIQVQNVYTGGSETSSARPQLDVTRISAPLNTPRAMEIWQKYYDEGLIDHEFHSMRSRTETSIMAKLMAEELNLREYWSLFEKLFEMTNLRTANGKAHENQAGWDFENRLMTLLDISGNKRK